MPEWDGDAVRARLAEMESYDPDYLYENKVLADDLAAALVEIDRLHAELAAWPDQALLQAVNAVRVVRMSGPPLEALPVLDGNADFASERVENAARVSTVVQSDAG